MSPRKTTQEIIQEKTEQRLRRTFDADLSPEVDGRRVLLETVDVIKQYRQYDQVVTAVNRATFRVFEGEFVAIVGASGSG